MILILDTHALLWWFDGDPRLSSNVRSLIEDEDNDILVSAASVWEIATKFRLGRLPGARKIALRLPEIIVEQGFRELPITIEHAQRAGSLEGNHRDPFDRMLAAQAQMLDVTIATLDRNLTRLGVLAVW
jgi:PIN domain nuclease of toxin-antitoxin system